MISIDRMALADYFKPEELVDEIYRQCPDLKLPIPVIDIALASGILTVNPLNLSPSAKLEGILLSDPLKEFGVILYKKHTGIIGRERFSISHELGHHLLQHHSSMQVCLVPFSSVSDEILEKEANKFATLLLMPKHLLQPYLSEQSLSLELIINLASKAEVSVAALANRCCEISNNSACIIIHSKDNICSYAWVKVPKSSNYQLKTQKKQIIPVGSHISKQPYTEETITTQRIISPSIWFKKNDESSLPSTVKEQTYYQKDGYAITLLIVD